MMRKAENRKIDKPYVILVEGFLDRAILSLVLRDIEANHEDVKEIIEKTQIFEIKGKDNLKANWLKNKISEAEDKLKAILVIVDKDNDYQATAQSVNSFLDKFNWIMLKDYLIIPDENTDGQELEDYLVATLEELEESKVQVLGDCIRKVSSDKKIGKKIFFSYLLVNDDCYYEGLSISDEMLGSCIDVGRLSLIQNKVLSFLENAGACGGES